MFKKLSALMLAGVMAFALAACTPAEKPDPTDTPDTAATSSATPADDQNSQASGSDTQTAAPEEPTYATVVDSDGNEAQVLQNPKKVAVYDYAILDILLSIGFENTGIEQLIVPSKDTLPAALDYYKNQGDDKVVTGGTLFYVDWDVLDLVQPDLVILGARSFGMNAAGERLDNEGKSKYISDTQERYSEAAFIKLAPNTSNAQLTVDMENNVNALAAIFPDIAPVLEGKMEQVKLSIQEIHDKAQASAKTALFCMMVDQTTLSVFNPNSRFDMIYEDFGFTSVDQDAVSWEDSHGFDVRAEYVLEKNPDVIFLLDRSATVGSGAGAENFFSDPIIAKTNAAANENIYVLSGDAWYTITGGFSAAEAMIADINQYIDTLE